MPPATLAPPALRTASPAFVGRLAEHGDRPALVGPAGILSYADLDAAVSAAAERLGADRRLVALPAHSTVDTVVCLLAALRGGHPVLLLPPCRAGTIAAGYAPDAVVENGRFRTVPRAQPDEDLHPDLALCLSTSGATGSGRLVRLSATNLQANAESIAQSLHLTADDRGVTALSLGYSYGLSVLTSHLAVGASVVLTEASVADDEFWRTVAIERVTTLPAVPYSLALMERAGLAERPLPDLRLVTCAGGGLPPERALAVDAAGRERGWGLALMYGQTEATARISCLPPELVRAHPTSAGRVVPGGRVRIDDPDSSGIGEIVYSGPNVMMGYAQQRADLARGHDIDELRTCDLGFVDDAGLLHVVGRRSRIAKVRGLRISLDDVDRALDRAGFDATTVAVDEGLAVATTSADRDACRQTAADACSLPPGLVTVVGIEAIPRTESGKVRHAEVADVVRDRLVDRPDLGRDRLAAPPDGTPDASDPLTRLRAAYSTMLARPAAPDDSFTSLGGDSLSYVEVSLAVEDVLGHLPAQWQDRSLAELAATSAPARRRGWRTLEGSVALRAAAIALVVGSHAQAFDIRGGAHVLMALVGYNIARFHLGVGDPRERMRRMGRSTVRVLAPAAVVLLALVLWGGYGWSVLGFTSLVHPTELAPEWRYWFVEALLWILPAMVLLLALPGVEALRRRYPFGLPLTLTGALFLAGRFLVPQEFPVSVFSPLAIAWFAALGWTIAEARTVRQRIALSVLLVAVVPWTLYGLRMLIVPIGLMALLWVTRVRVPAPVAVAVAAVAEASLAIYLLHWPVLDLVRGWTAVAVSALVGVAATWAAVRLCRTVRRTAETVEIPTKR